MLKVNKSKSVIGVLSLLLLVSLAPPANAGMPGSTPTLGRKLCTEFGGSWVAGKNATCYLVNNFDNYGDFTVKAGQELRVTGGQQFNNYGIINNSGKIITYGIFMNKNVVNNSGYIASICPDGVWAGILPVGTGDFYIPSC